MCSMKYLIVILAFLGGHSFTASSASSYEDSYANCYVRVNIHDAPGVSLVPIAEKISRFIIQDAISRKMSKFEVPDMLNITDSGFYFFFHGGCDKKKDLSKYYLDWYVNEFGLSGRVVVTPLSKDEVQNLKLRKITRH